MECKGPVAPQIVIPAQIVFGDNLCKILQNHTNYCLLVHKLSSATICAALAVPIFRISLATVCAGKIKPNCTNCCRLHKLSSVAVFKLQKIMTITKMMMMMMMIISVGGLEAGLGVDTNSSSPRSRHWPLPKKPVNWIHHNVELSSCIKLIYIMKTFLPSCLEQNLCVSPIDAFYENTHTHPSLTHTLSHPHYTHQSLTHTLFHTHITHEHTHTYTHPSQTTIHRCTHTHTPPYTDRHTHTHTHTYTLPHTHTHTHPSFLHTHPSFLPSHTPLQTHITHTHTHILIRGFNRGYDYMLRATGHIPLFISENHVLHTFDKLTNLIENSSDLRCRFTLISKKFGFVYNRGTYIHVATGHVCYYFWFSPL